MGIIKGLFNSLLGISSTSYDTNTTTARDLVSSTSSTAPEAAVMGDDNIKKKKNGISSLLVE